MSRSIDGYLMLGWEVEVWDAGNYDLDDGLSEGAEERVTEILGKPWLSRGYAEPIVFPSLYLNCDYMYVGLVLISSKYDWLDAKTYGEFLASNARLFESTAKDLYAAIMGKEACDEPRLMCVTCDG